MKTFRIAPLLIVLGLLTFTTTPLLQSCSSAYDAMGMQNVTNLSSKLTTLMSKAATSTYDANKSEVEMVTADLKKAQEHCTAQKRNQEIANSWKILQEEQVEPFLTRWKEGMLDKDYVKEATAQVQKSFDAIKKAEQAKSK